MPPNSKSVRLLMLGDTGHFNLPIRQLIARESQRAPYKRPDAICLLGDNFYPGGVTRQGMRNFLETFKPLADVPRLMILGNHDYCHNARVFLNSPHWTMPDYSYALDVGPVSLIMIDTVQIEPNWSTGKGGSGHPGDPWTTPGRVRDATGLPQPKLHDRELGRLRAFLHPRKHKFTIVCGHYPLVSNGLYNISAKLRQAILPLLDEFKANAYVCGHEHSLEHTALQLPSGHMCDHFISGASSEARSATIRRHPGWVYAGLGSLAVETTDNKVKFMFSDAAGRKLNDVVRPLQQE
jgi:tartrate-resistant acid phosphatase type 5